MKTFISLIFAIVLTVAGAFASDLVWTPITGFHGVSQAPVQFFAPATVTALTVNSTTFSLSNYILYEFESGSGATCYMRVMATSTKTGTPTLFRTAGTRRVYSVNPSATYVNLSGCTAGSFLSQ